MILNADGPMATTLFNMSIISIRLPQIEQLFDARFLATK